MVPGSGRSPGEGNGNPLQYSCLEEPGGLQSKGSQKSRPLKKLVGGLNENLWILGHFLAVQWLGLHTFHWLEPQSIPGGGTKILQALEGGKKISKTPVNRPILKRKGLIT